MQQPPRLRLSRKLTLFGVLAVALLLLAGNNTLIITLFLIAPLLIVSPGLVKGWYRSYSWLSLMILLYFIVAVTQLMGPNGSWLDGVYVAITVSVFFTATFSSRWLQQLQVQLLDGQPLAAQQEQEPSA